MSSIKALLRLMIAFVFVFTFALTTVMAAPSMYHNGTSAYSATNGTSLGRRDPPAGDHLARVTVWPFEFCKGPPNSYDMVGTNGRECWNYDGAVSVQVYSASDRVAIKQIKKRLREAF
ncbi:MAG: hypothetical protein LQ352_000138 [Teloschistes flavicans]|nr:MAG: hypothetical protein LQ352_000138 [Teloschistes flavicans]